MKKVQFLFIKTIHFRVAKQEFTGICNQMMGIEIEENKTT